MSPLWIYFETEEMMKPTNPARAGLLRELEYCRGFLYEALASKSAISITEGSEKQRFIRAGNYFSCKINRHFIANEDSFLRTGVCSARCEGINAA